MNLDPVRSAYSQAADLYIELFAAGDHMPADDLALIARHLTGGGEVLDLGCGPGHLTAHLHSLGVPATGIDMVPEFIAYARATHPEVPFRVASMHQLDVPARSVDGILAYYSLIHLPPPDLDTVLAEFRRVLAPGGRLVVGFITGDAAEPFDHKVATAYCWPIAEMAARLRRAGFTELERRQGEGPRPDRRQATLATLAV